MSVVLPNTPVGFLALALEALDDIALSVFRGPLCGIEHRVLWYGGRSWRHAPSGDPGLEREWSGAIGVTVGATPSSWVARVTSAAMSNGESTAGAAGSFSVAFLTGRDSFGTISIVDMSKPGV
ncbi:hypothetical protein BASA81_009669 [Batrachochytrium salamandrivorans]|nr:hypothetical protein BASA81_009669 [Batrachochytrium salamandrivorans]